MLVGSIDELCFQFFEPVGLLGDFAVEADGFGGVRRLRVPGSQAAHRAVKLPRQVRSQVLNLGTRKRGKGHVHWPTASGAEPGFHQIRPARKLFPKEFLTCAQEYGRLYIFTMSPPFHEPTRPFTHSSHCWDTSA